MKLVKKQKQIVIIVVDNRKLVKNNSTMRLKLLTRHLTITLIAGIFCNLYGQTDTLYYINSSFENSEDQELWTSTPSHATIKWDYKTGGYNYPISAVSGDLNAIFYWSDVGFSPYRTLISSPIDLSTAEKPELSFWHAQAPSVFGQDELYLLFKAGATANWDTISSFTNSTTEWTRRIYNLDEIDEKYLCEDFYVAFLGHANGGQGVCLDSVVLKETAVIDKFIKSINYSAIQQELVTSKMQQVPIIKIDIEVIGNNGNSLLNNISFNLESGDADLFKANGFRLFHTKEAVFKNKENASSTQVGGAVSLSGGQVTFSGLNHNLNLGWNYLWLTADIADDAEHNSQFIFGINSESASVIDTLLPVSAITTVVTKSITEAVFYDNFSTDLSWDREGDFEQDIPQGLSSSKSKDPAYAFSGTTVLGTDLTDDGMYEDGVSEGSPYYATSPLIDLKYYDDVKLYMRKWNDFDALDRASIEISTNGGSKWTTIWQSQINNPSPSSEWDELIFTSTADKLISREDSVQVRFGILKSDALFGDARAGFNIDNFTIAGNYLDTDVGISQIMTPFDDCIGSNNDTVKIIVRNFADSATPPNIPVYFGLWGADSTLVHDTIPGSIAKDGSVVFTFTQLANFPRGDFYDNFIVGVNLPGDEDASNDTLSKKLYIPNTYKPPYKEDFEYNGGIWIPSDGSAWLCKEPASLIPVLPESPNTWIQSPYGVYSNNDTSYLTGNCYDLALEKRLILELDYWLVSEPDKDGAAIQYSTDDGETWNFIDETIYGAGWNWYNTPVAALGHDGWSGDSDGWVNARELLPAGLSTEVKVKFRVVWASDGQNNAQGFAFDNFNIYPAPPDVGVSTIEVPEDACQFVYPNEISLWVKNFGYNSLSENDTIILGYDFEDESAVINTFFLDSDLAPGDSTLFTIPTSFDVAAAGTYEIQAYTLIEDDPFFYIENNDTTSKTFEVFPIPITDLPDTISSRQPDTLLIEPHFDPQYSYLWGDGSTTPTYDVTKPGTYYLTVSSSELGCEAYDSVYIQLLFADVGIDSIIWPQSSCELSSSENVQVQIRNLGTDSLIIDDKILLYYEFNYGQALADSITLTEALYSGQTIWFTFEEKTEDLSLIGDYHIKTYTDYGGDTVAMNDTLVRTISVHGYPTLNLGEDMIIDGLTYDLQADPGFETYLWDNGETNSNRLIDTSGYYWLDVWDEYGCPASDSIDIWFRIRDVSPQMLVSPTSSCDREGLETVTMRVINSGSDTLYSGDDIYISYNLDEGAWTNQTLNISQLLPGQIYDYTFAPSHDLTELGTYVFNITANTPGDMRETNDTLAVDVLTATEPVVELDVDEEEVYKVPELVLDAGFNENYSYLWQDGSTEQTYTVTDITPVEVLVTDVRTGCYGGDTVRVYLDILDYMVTTIGVDEDICSDTYKNLPVTLINNGNLPRGGATITLDYSQNGSFLFTEQFENIGNWPAGASRVHTTRNSIDLNTLGNGDLEIEITTDGDLRPENDLYTLDYEIIQSPEVDLGGSRQEVDFPYTFDAGSGHSSYLWSTGATSSSITVYNPGTYSVSVTGTNGCVTTKTAYVDTVLILSPGAESEMFVSVYPNPADSYITIEASFENPGDYILEIFNAQNSLFISREIYEAEYREEFYIGDLPPGFYFIRIRNSEFYQVSKMIVQ